MDESCLEILSKYIQSPQVAQCLELAGYTTPSVLGCLNDSQLDDIVNYVRETCAILPEEERHKYIGPVFAKDPQHFRFPSGIRCGILLAVADIRKQENKNDTSVTQVTQSQSCLTVSTQTNLKLGIENLNWPLILSNQFSNGHMNNFGESMNHDFSLMSAEQQESYDVIPVPSPSSNIDNMDPISPNVKMMLPRSPPLFDALDSNTIERIKIHSAKSIIRLSSRQFLDGHLVKDRDFHLDMEMSSNESGGTRVTGIFYCHLCLETRKTMTPLRFSVARNRYPVVSNVLSHLRIHFQYKLPRTYPAHSTIRSDSSMSPTTPRHLSQNDTEALVGTSSSLSGGPGLDSLSYGFDWNRIKLENPTLANKSMDLRFAQFMQDNSSQSHTVNHSSDTQE